MLKPENKLSLVIISSLFLSIYSSHLTAKSAEEIIFISGNLSRTIPIKALDEFAKTQEAKGALKNIMDLTKLNKEEISEFLNEEFELPIVITSKLMYSQIGEVILKRVAKIIYPLRVPQPSVSIPAIRSGVIVGLKNGKGKINLIRFLKGYPNKIITIDVPELFKVISKVESMSDLVRFFSDSPLERLKQRKP